MAKKGLTFEKLDGNIAYGIDDAGDWHQVNVKGL